MARELSEVGSTFSNTNEFDAIQISRQALRQMVVAGELQGPLEEVLPFEEFARKKLLTYRDLSEQLIVDPAVTDENREILEEFRSFWRQIGSITLGRASRIINTQSGLI